MIQSAQESLTTANRRILVMGASGSGKTTFSVSASKYAGEVIGKGEPVVCSDTVILSGDSEGVLGAVDAGLCPNVIDFTDCISWEDKLDSKTRERSEGYKTRLAKAIGELRPLVAAGKIKVVVVDLSLPSRLIVAQFRPEQISEWNRVAEEGLTFFNALSALRGCTVIGNCHVKSGHVLESKSPSVAAGQKAAAEAKAVDGELNTFTADLPKGVSQAWVWNSSFIFAREVRREAKRDARGMPSRESSRVFYTHTAANGRYEAKSRAHTKLAPTEPGERTLKNMMDAVYDA